MTALVCYLENALTPQNRIVHEIEPCSIHSLAPDWDIPFIAFVDGHPVLRADWELVLVDNQALIFIDVNAIPQGGGGGGGSNPLATILMLAVMVYAPGLAANMFFGDGIMAAAALGQTGLVLFNAGVIMAGMSLISAIIPSPQPTSNQSANALAAASPTYNLQAQGNTARLEAAIPEHFGRMLAYPDFAAQPYAEYSGNDQFVYQLLCIGRGSYDIESIRIENTPISSFEEITTQIVQPNTEMTLFPSSVTSSIEVSGQTLDASYIGPFVASAAGDHANFIGVDFVASKGLYYANDNGSLASVSISLQVEAQPINDVGATTGGWVVLSSSSDATFTGATTTPQRYSLRFPVTHGRYQIRVKRLDTEHTETRYGHEIAWIGLRSYLNNVTAFGDVTLLALRMRASNNLSLQASRKVNVIATRKIPIWNGTSWSANTATTSIAWPLAYACKSVGMTDAQIDLPTLLALDAIWDAREDSFNGRFDSFLSFWEAVTKIGGAGRTKPYLQGGVMRFMRDQTATVPVALFSMRNIIAGSFSVDYLMPTPETADQIDVGYFDQDTWTAARVPSILPGVEPIRPIKVDLFGVTSREQAHREGMYLAATNRFRRKAIKFSTEMDGFIPSFGDLIAIQHDMPAWGQGGEVTAWAPLTRTVTLSEVPTWGTGTHYIGLRKRDGSVSGPYVVTPGAHANELILATTPGITPYVDDGEERTHYSFGWADTWRHRARVISARPQGLNQVSIEAVNEDDNVHTADQGIITPVAPVSQLAGYTNAPVVTGVTVTPMLYKPNVLVIAWQPAPWANYYIVQQSSDGVIWTDAGNTGLNTLTISALYGTTTHIRVAAFGMTRGPWAYPGAVTVDKTPPPRAPAATATGAMFAVQLDWTFGDTIGERTGTEIWWCSTNNRAIASRLSVEPFPGQSYLHVGLSPGQGGYYWIRVGDKYGNFSPYYPLSATGGLHAVAITDPSDLLTFLNNAIGTNQLTANLNTKVTLIDTVNSKVTQAAADLLAEATARGAAISAESTIRQAAESSIAQSVTTLSAATGTNIAAAVQTETTARTNADTSLASSITTVASSVTTANAAIQAEATTRANADTATAGTIATVVASVVTANAAIQSEASTRASGDSAQATLTGQVQARLDTGDFATVKSTANAMASRTGVLEARHTVHLDVNGYVSGTESVNDGATSSFVVLADKFLVAKPNGTGTPVPMLTLGTINGVSALGVAGALIMDGAIAARSLNVTSLAAVSATIGTLRTATSGSRLEISDNVIKVFGPGPGGTTIVRVQIGNLAL